MENALAFDWELVILELELVILELELELVILVGRLLDFDLMMA